MTFLKFVETTKFRSRFCGRITHSERFRNTRPGHLSEHVKEQGINIKVLFTLALANSCKQLKNRGSDGWWKIEKCFVKKDTDRSIRRTLSTAEKKNIVSWSYKTPKSTIQSHFCNFLATIFPYDLNVLLISFPHWKARRPWTRALRKKLLRLRISPGRRLGRICSIMAASFGRNWSLKVYVFLKAFCLHLPNWFTLILRIHTEGTSAWNISVYFNNLTPCFESFISSCRGVLNSARWLAFRRIHPFLHLKVTNLGRRSVLIMWSENNTVEICSWVKLYHQMFRFLGRPSPTMLQKS